MSSASRSRTSPQAGYDGCVVSGSDRSALRIVVPQPSAWLSGQVSTEIVISGRNVELRRFAGASRVRVETLRFDEIDHVELDTCGGEVFVVFQMTTGRVEMPVAMGLGSARWLRDRLAASIARGQWGRRAG